MIVFSYRHIKSYLLQNAKGIPPIKYKAVQDCLHKVGQYANGVNASVRMLRIGCGLADGTWDKIEPLIGFALSSEGISYHIRLLM